MTKHNSFSLALLAAFALAACSPRTEQEPAAAPAAASGGNGSVAALM